LLFTCLHFFYLSFLLSLFLLCSLFYVSVSI
jgi:hypothetical protein